ncbi:hypothetical protein SIN8267_00429 [Sinobacterium norvegicum]|uniref:Uncharacterized protein n=1 Tax=Sinobacterium norvegicum TaxID=1641715 RepID=A0ABM9ABS8_9GAMM|nr:hypothetical protein [Sinobacterium norvegicum]CAH0990337.1 hypothetical protein SIN8267_00429 [Sinobacterium norvegicum]
MMKLSVKGCLIKCNLNVWVLMMAIVSLSSMYEAQASNSLQKCVEAATKKQKRDSLRYSDSFDFIGYQSRGEENVFGSFEIDLRYQIDEDKKKRSYKCNKHGSIESRGEERWDYSPASRRRNFR